MSDAGVALAGMSTLTCSRCGFEWLADVSFDGKVRRLCLDCRESDREKRAASRGRVIDLTSFEPGSPSYVLGLRMTEYRVAMEIARTALRLGKYEEAAEHLDRALFLGKRHKTTRER